MLKNNKSHYVKLKRFNVDEILNKTFTRSKRKELTSKCDYTSEDWKEASKKTFIVNGKKYSVKMGSHRYQLFAEKGCVCQHCGIEGKYFTLEYSNGTNQDKPHFNLYGINDQGEEIMLTKDHIIPRSKGGRNRLDNYQVLCIKCNAEKADKIV